MRILAGISIILCFLSILVAIWLPGVLLQGGATALIFLAFSMVLFGLSDPELKG